MNPELVKQWSEATQKAEPIGMICGFVLSQKSSDPRPFADGVEYDAVDFKLLSWSEKVYVPMYDLQAISELQD